MNRLEQPSEDRGNNESFFRSIAEKLKDLCERTTGAIRERILGTDVEPFETGERVYVLLPNGEMHADWVVSRGTKGKLICVSPEKRIIRHQYSHTGTTLDPSRTAHADEIEQGAVRRKSPLCKEFVTEQLRRRMLEQHATLSKTDFDLLFSGNLEQQNVGNCFLIAALNSIRHSRHGEAIIRTSVRRRKPPDQQVLEVGFPLGSPEKKMWIPVGGNDLKPELFDREGRAFLHPVKARAGWQTLEAAYIKLRTKSDTVRRKAVDDGGTSDFTLLDMFGTNVNLSSVGKDRDVIATQGQDMIAAAKKWLHRYSNNQDIATAATRRPKTEDEKRTGRYVAAGYRGPRMMNTNHAYSITHVDRANEIVTVENPHDTSKKMTFTFDQFLAAFSVINGVQISHQNLFRPTRSPSA